MKCQPSHVCRRPMGCTCGGYALEPDEQCPAHGAGEWPPRCEECGRLMPWPTEAAVQDAMISTSQFDLDDPHRNIFGIAPCPGCGDRLRWPTRPVHPQHPNCILCDRCGRVEPITEDR